MKPIRIAIIGYGKIAADQHVPSIQGNDRFELVATSSRSGQGVARTFTDWRQLIRSVDGLEAVAITTPPGPRFEIARECVAAGLSGTDRADKLTCRKVGGRLVSGNGDCFVQGH